MFYLLLRFYLDILFINEYKVLSLYTLQKFRWLLFQPFGVLGHSYDADERVLEMLELEDVADDVVRVLEGLGK